MKPALVVSGGGSKGAFAVGAIRYIRERLNVDFGLVAGTSTGAAIAPLVVTDELDMLERFYTSVHDRDILKPVSLQTTFAQGYLFDTAPLEKLLAKTLDEARARKILDATVPAFLATVCLQTGRLTYFQTGRFAGQVGPDVDLVTVTDRASLIRAIVASANQPVFMPPVWIPPNQKPVRQYVDGGVREYGPIDVAIVNGALEIYVVMPSPASANSTTREDTFQSLPKIAARAIGLLVDEVGQNDLRLAQLYSEASLYLETVRRNARGLGLSNLQVTQLFEGPNPFVGRRPVVLHVIRPEADLPTEGLSFDPKVMKELVKLGARRAEAALKP